MEVGNLVQPIKGIRNRKIGVVKSINGENATVMMSKSGVDYTKEFNIKDLEKYNLTADFINEVVTLNS